MDDRTAWMLLCRQLTLEFPDLIFWKHLARGLNGSGDIDAVAPAAEALHVVRRMPELVKENFPDAVLVFACRHAANVHPIFVVSKRIFPRLAQFDVSFNPIRFGMPWCNPADLVRFSVLDEHGIRVLRQGALAVVLLMLYGINRDGRSSLKAHDWSDIALGWANDPEVAKQFVQAVLPIAIQKPMRDVLESLGREDNGSKVRALWWACARTAMFHHLCHGWKPLTAILRRRLANLCAVQTAVHHHDRVIQCEHIVSFIQKIQDSENVLFERKPEQFGNDL
ncbi:MAG: hypothetical protein ACD_23C00305G0001 [uncultured bacterium]|nr:MAG: hypothetical protein ACD_23C00305G0001 [uncultured bacterium]